MIAGFIVPSIVMAPINGRLFDRFGISRLLPLQQLLFAALMTLLIVMINRQGAGWIIIVGCIVLGSAAAGSGGAMRAVLNGLLDHWLVDRAVAVDSLIIELTIITAPLIVVSVSWFGSLGGVYAMLSSFVAASILTWRLLPSAPPSDTGSHSTVPTGVLGATIAPSSIRRQQATDRVSSHAQRAEAFATIFAANAL